MSPSMGSTLPNQQRKSLLDEVGKKAMKNKKQERELLTMTTKIPTLAWQKPKDEKILKKDQFLKIEKAR